MTKNTESEAPNISALTIDLYDPTVDSLDEITNLLHSAYARLAEMGFNYVAATQSTAITQERLADGVSYIARFDDRIIGTITYYQTTPNSIDEPDAYRNKDTGHFGQFAVSPLMQKHGIGNKLMGIIEAHALRDGKRVLACDTAEGATHLIDYYRKHDYQAIGYHQWPHACYRSVILAKTLIQAVSPLSADY